MLLLLGLLVGCGTDDPCASTRDLTASPGGLALTRDEHPVGWGSTECFQCHQRWEIHANDCLQGAAVNGADIPTDTTEGCQDCHGWNGVPAWSKSMTPDTGP
jgi:hypothetical protein